MGTSRPRPDAPPEAPLIPPWADKDPAPPPLPQEPLPENPVPEPEDEPGPPADEVVDGEDDIEAEELAEPRRFAAFRTALRRYATSANRDDLRKALGKWAKKSVGGGSAASRRLARAARVGGAALVGLTRAGAGLAPVGRTLDLRTLAGLPMDAAIRGIVDTFMPPGILDEVTARIAMEEALAVALAGADTFSPEALDANAIRIATLAFVGELVFIQVAGDAGATMAAIGPVAAAQREADIRAVVREIVDLVGSPIVATAGVVLSEQRMSELISQIVLETLEEVATW